MNHQLKRQVIATLIKAGRRDLAYVVAGKWPSLTVKTILAALKAKRVATTVLDAVAELAAGGGLTREQLEGALKRFTGALAKDAKRVADTFGLYEGMMLGTDVNPMRLETARFTRRRRPARCRPDHRLPDSDGRRPPGHPQQLAGRAGSGTPLGKARINASLR